MIVNANDIDGDWEVVSIPGKYYSYIPPVTLTKGSYILVISPLTTFGYEEADIVKFEMDFMY